MLKEFKVEHETPTHIILKHPKGHSLALEKSSLSPKAHEMIKMNCGGMAEGGDIANETTVVPDKGFGKIIIVDDKRANQKAYGGFSDESVRKMDEGGPAPQPTPSPEPSGLDMPIGTNTVLRDEAPSQEVAQEAPIEAPQPAPAPKAAPQAAPQEPLSQAKSESGQLLEKQGAGAEKYQKTLADIGAQQQKIYQDFNTQMAAMQTPDQIMANHKAKDDEFLQHLMDSNVDPNRLWSNASTGSKITAAIGLVLSGMGAGANGQNMAAATLQNAINRDIAEQQNDQSKYMNLWKMNREALGNDLQANLATKNQLLSMTQAKLAQTASTLTNAAAQQQAQQAIFAIEQEKINNRRAQALLSPQQGAGGVGGLAANPLDVVRTVVPPDKQEAVAKEVGRAMSVAQSKDEMLRAFDMAAKDTRPLTGKSVTSVMNLIPGYHPQSINSLDSAVEPMITDVDKKINEITKKTAERNFPALGDSDERIQEKRRALENLSDERASSPLFKTYTGVDLSNFQKTQANPIGRAPAQIQQYYAYAKAHPEQKVSQDFFAKHPEFR